MRKIITGGLITLTIVGFLSCNGGNSNYKNTAELPTQTERWVWPDSVRDILAVPDSLQERFANESGFDLKAYWTPEQKQLFSLLITTMVEYTKGTDNDSLIFDISREDFVKKGIPEPYYDQLSQNVKDFNTMKSDFEKYDDQSLVEWWEENKRKTLNEFTFTE